jgi:hypothetical protein
VLKLNGFLAALTVILRELFGIRRALRRDGDREGDNE